MTSGAEESLHQLRPDKEYRSGQKPGDHDLQLNPGEHVAPGPWTRRRGWWPVRGGSHWGQQPPAQGRGGPPCLRQPCDGGIGQLEPGNDHAGPGARAPRAANPRCAGLRGNTPLPGAHQRGGQHCAGGGGGRRQQPTSKQGEALQGNEDTACSHTDTSLAHEDTSH